MLARRSTTQRPCAAHTRRVGRGAVVIAGILAIASCSFGVGPRDNETLCPQTYEFGNYGCTRIVAIVAAPPTPWPAPFSFGVYVRPARSAERQSFGNLTSPVPGALTLDLTALVPLEPRNSDTLSVWVVGALVDMAGTAVNGRVPVFATDSVLRVLRFATVGATRTIDTVSLALKRTN